MGQIRNVKFIFRNFPKFYQKIEKIENFEKDSKKSINSF